MEYWEWVSFTFTLLVFACSTTCQEFQIIGGAVVGVVGEFPYIVWWQPGCTGVLLSPLHILTFKSLKCEISGEVILAGTTDLHTYVDSREATMQYQFPDNLRYYEYNETDPQMVVYELNSPFIMGKEIRPISLASTDFQIPEFGYVVGFPQLNFGGHDTHRIRLQKLRININSRIYCAQLGLELCTAPIEGGVGTCAFSGPSDPNLVPLIAKTSGGHILCGLLVLSCCGMPRCHDGYVDLTKENHLSWLSQFTMISKDNLT